MKIIQYLGITAWLTLYALSNAIQAQELIQYGSPVTYNDPVARAAFPQSWGQYGNNQQRNPVFGLPADAPAFLIDGVMAVAPTTGDEFRRVQAARRYFPDDGNLSFGSTASQWIGNVVGTAVAQGIVYVTTSRREIYALDAQTSLAIWRKELVGAAGMGQPLIQTINGQLRVIVTVGDADYNGKHAIRKAFAQPYQRGAEYSAIYCLDALTGAEVWRYDIQGSARATPLYRDGVLYAVNGDGNLYILNAATGALISRFTNPDNGQVGMSSPNWYLTENGRLLLFYGTINPRNLLAIDVTQASNPRLAWSLTPPAASANAPGDVSMAVDPASGLVVTSVFSNLGTGSAPQYDLHVIAMNAKNGRVVWSQFAGRGNNLPGFKSGNPMIDRGTVYLGNPLNATVQAYNLADGRRLWSTAVTDPDPSIRLAPRVAPILAYDTLIVPVGQHIFSFNPSTGALLNDFHVPFPYVGYGLNQPVVIGNQVYLSSVSGWVHYFPLQVIFTQPSPPPEPITDLAPKTAEYYDPSALPDTAQQADFPQQWLSYAGNPGHTSYMALGPSLTTPWSTALANALPLNEQPLGNALFGTEWATHMTHHAFGVGSGVSAARGILYAAGNDRTINAFNATTGQLIWRFRTNNHNPSQPLVTADAVIVAGGNQALNLGNSGRFAAQSSSTRIGTGFMYVHALEPTTGNEKWTFYAGQGAASMTPLYHNGVLYWVDGESRVWAIDATNGQPVAPFMDNLGQPLLRLGGGYNSHSSANLYQDTNGRALLVVGMSMPSRMVAIDLNSAQIAWTQGLPGRASHITGFANTSPAIDLAAARIYSSTLLQADPIQGTAQVLAFALDAASGTVLWEQALASGKLPDGFVAPTPMISEGRVYISNPGANQLVALDAELGTPVWTSPVVAADKFAWGPPAMIGAAQVLLPTGTELISFDATSGTELRRHLIGGAFTHNHPTVLGNTVYIGNSYGWVMGLPLSYVSN